MRSVIHSESEKECFLLDIVTSCLQILAMDKKRAVECLSDSPPLKGDPNISFLACFWKNVTLVSRHNFRTLHLTKSTEFLQPPNYSGPIKCIPCCLIKSLMTFQ
eukprot:Gregarina_sp_Poly_1__2149@NODE_156_length_12377_cov_161_699350_g138_i0_p11_GENE_NODE_156_length_12377_cov_161_699350_g138_i0NODE_156_length_12377_cov_161_699350_g138_i0_p11_ORF_typecomplete_len104_score7_43Crust_neurohorm/PF01147_17/0_011_NODE_156_length_12377_cov_161_699350_g138_i0151462